MRPGTVSQDCKLSLVAGRAEERTKAQRESKIEPTIRRRCWVYRGATVPNSSPSALPPREASRSVCNGSSWHSLFDVQRDCHRTTKSAGKNQVYRRMDDSPAPGLFR